MDDSYAYFCANSCCYFCQRMYLSTYLSNADGMKTFECHSRPERAWSPTFPQGCNNLPRSLLLDVLFEYPDGHNHLDSAASHTLESSASNQEET
jgi:hypothetical protein